jgi:hypothetical protein
MWGIQAGALQPVGFAFSMWVYVWAFDSVLSSFLQCSSSSTSTADLFHIFAMWQPPGNNEHGLSYKWVQESPAGYSTAAPWCGTSSQGSVQYSGATCQNPLQYGLPGLKLPLQQWAHIGGGIDEFGQFRLLINGQALSVVQAQTYLPRRVPRMYCSINRDATSPSNANRRWTGAVGGMQFLTRGLQAEEFVVLAQNPPPTVVGNFTVTGMPLIGLPSLTWKDALQIEVATSLIAGATVELVFTVSNGFTSPSSILFSPTSRDPKKISLTLLDLPAGVTNWTIVYTLARSAAPFYVAPTPLVIMLASPATITATMDWSLPMHARSLQADWMEGVTSGTGLVSFKSVGVEWLDLTLPANMLGGPVIPQFGGVRQAWTISMWLWATNVIAGAVLFDCNVDNGNANRVGLNVYASTGQLAAYLYRPSHEPTMPPLCAILEGGYWTAERS